MKQKSERKPSESEAYCAASFSEWVRKQRSNVQLEWLFEPNGPSTAPDYHLMIDGQQFAIEVAIVMPYEVVGGETMSDVGVRNFLYRFLKDLEKKLKSKGILVGVYVVDFPQPIAGFGKVRRRLELDLTNFICNTIEVTSHPPAEIRSEDGRLLCTIDKHGNYTTYIAMTGLGSGGLEGEIYEELCTIVRSEIDDKCAILRNETLPRILLLHDMYLLGSPYMWPKCITAYDLAMNFHTVFVSSTLEDFAAYTKEASWPTLDTNSFSATTGWPGNWPSRGDEVQ